MKKVVLKLLCCLIGCSSIPLIAEMPTFECDIQTGYRQDSLSWNIAAPFHSPNILSELKWKDLQIFEIAVCGKMVTSSGYYLRASGDYGKAFSGTCWDSDYFGDNRTEEFSRSKADASASEVFDLSLATGKQFDFFQNILKVSPVIGYSLHEQNLKQQKGVQVINEIYQDNLGPFPGLNSTYRARWHGPFVGIDLNCQATCKINLLATLEYHLVTYKGLGDWNLRREFYRDFEHTANGDGVLGSLGALYQINERLSVGMTLNYEAFKTLKGKDRTYLYAEYEGEVLPLIMDTCLNSVKWHSFSALVTLKLSF